MLNPTRCFHVQFSCGSCLFFKRQNLILTSFSHLLVIKAWDSVSCVFLMNSEVKPPAFSRRPIAPPISCQYVILPTLLTPPHQFQIKPAVFPGASRGRLPLFGSASMPTIKASFLSVFSLSCIEAPNKYSRWFYITSCGEVTLIFTFRYV